MKMDKKQLKEILKPIVKEVIAEMFVSMQLEQIIIESLQKINFDGMLSENKQNNVSARQIQVQSQKIKPNPDMSEYRRKMMDSIFVGEREEVENKIVPIKKDRQKNVLQEMLADTAQSGFEIDSEEGTNPELVSSEQVEQLVGGKDFSKFLVR
mgnify:CR=1 FL=1